MFDIKRSWLNDRKKFNKKVVDKKYRQLAKVYHPDRGGTQMKFRELCANYGILLAIIDNEKKEDVVAMIQAIALTQEI